MKKIFYLIIALAGFVVATSDLQAQVSSLVINEIYYNPPNGSDDTLEFVELYNAGANAVNVMGYRLKSSSVGSGINVELPDITVDPAGFLVIAADSATMINVFGVAAVEWNAGKSLNNTSKDVVLFDQNNVVVDSVTYYNSAPWPSISSSGGPSVELLSAEVDNADGNYWEKSQQVKHIIVGQDTLQTLYCSPGTANINQRPIVQFSSDKRVISAGETVTFTNESLNYDSIMWTFHGGDIEHSQLDNPQVTYNDYGMFDVELYAANDFGDKTVSKVNHVILLPSCPLQTSLPYSVTFDVLPDCWFSYPSAGVGQWTLDNTYGYNDNMSMKFDCASYPADVEGALFTCGFDLQSTQQASFSFYYSCPENKKSSSSAPVITVESYSSEYELVQSESFYGSLLDSWALFSMSVGKDEVYFSVTVRNRDGNNAVYIDDVTVQDRPANSCMISGYVTEGGEALSGVLVQVQPGDIGVTTDGSGYYYTYVQKGWSGTVRPANPQYIYSPEYVEYIDLQDDVADVDFDANQLPSGWVYYKTASSHTFCIPQCAINVDDINVGSWIGVFYEDSVGVQHCCGAAQYLGETIMCINAWAANPETGDAGFSTGDTIYWKIFESSLMRQYDGVVTYSSGQEVFTSDGVTMIEQLSIEMILQKLVVPKGWNGISSYVVPYDGDLTTLLGEYADDVVIMMNDEGSYIPNVNSEITEWDANKGWTIKTLRTIVIDFLGQYNSDLTVDFAAGWTSFPIKSSQPIPIDSLFDGATGLDIIKGYGNNEIYIPGVTNSFDLKPGKSYKARFSSPYSIDFGAIEGSGVTQVITLDSLADVVINGDELNLSPLDHVLYIKDVEHLQDGDTVLVCAMPGTCYGFGVVENGAVIMKVYGDDPTTDEVDGMVIGDKMKLFVERNGSRYEMTYMFDKTTVNYDMFVVDGYTMICQVALVPVELEDEEIVVYPNPVTDELKILVTGNNQRCSYAVVDCLGYVIREGMILEGENVFDVRDLKTGVYILRIIINNQVITEKFVKV